MSALPLFYPQAIDLTHLQQYALGLFEPPAADVIEFAGQEGGTVERELAIPYLHGMDTVVVERAMLRLQSRPREMDVDFDARETAEPGIVVVLPRLARLRKVGIDYSVPEGLAGQTVRVIVRNAEPQHGGFAFSPPVYAHPDFGAPGPMFPRPLAGLTSTATPGGAVLGFPRPLGRAWLIQIATGDEVVDLTALDVTPTVRFVRIDAVPENLTLAIRLADESPDLWAHPQLFLPEAGVQEVDFSPLAQKRLAEVLREADAQSAVTLSVSLEFRSTSGGDASIVSRTLDARYQVDAIGEPPRTVRLGGGWTPLSIAAPASLRPAAIAADLTVRPLGRELNAASVEPPAAAPSRGLRVRQGAMVAGSLRFAAPDASRLADTPLVSVRTYAAAAAACELVLELRADAAGAPGAPVAPPAVLQLDAGFTGWAEFDLAQPWIPSAASVDLWVCLRTNQGELWWYANPEQPPEIGMRLVSLDRGASWGAADEVLGPTRPLLVQAFHAVPDPQPEPIVRLHRDASLLSANLLRANGQAPRRQGPREFVLEAASLPPALSALLAETPGTGKITTALTLFSRAVADLQITRLQLEYDPFQASAAGTGIGG